MRLYEFQSPDDDLPDDSSQLDDNNAVESITNLMTVLNYVIKRAENTDSDPKINTNALINMVKNTGVSFDYQSLVDAYDNSEAVKNLIKNFSKSEVELVGSADDEVSGEHASGEDSGDAIERIAKRVAQRSIK